MKFDANGVTIDEYAQTILWLLRDADEQRCASQLVDEVDLDTTQKVRHRIDNLQRAGLIDHTESIKHQEGAQIPTKYYVINETGLEWLFEHQENVDDAVGRKRYIDSLDRLRELLMNFKEVFREKVAALEDADEALRSDVVSEFEAVRSEISTLRSRISDEESARKKGDEELIDEIEQLRARVDSLESELEGIDLKTLASNQNNLRERVAHMEQRLDDQRFRIDNQETELQSINLAKVITGDVDPSAPGEPPSP